MEKSIKELLTSFDDVNRLYYTRKVSIEAKIARLEKQKKKLESTNYDHHWTNSLLNPIGEVLQRHFNAHHYEILGPFGLSCETSIHVWLTLQKQKTTQDRENVDWNQCISITFRPGNIHGDDLLKGITSTLYLRDYSVNTNAFYDNTLGSINGFNNPSINIEDWSMDQIIEYVEKTNESKLKLQQ